MSSLTPAINSDADDTSLSGDKNGHVIRFNGRSLLLKFAGVLIFLGAWYLGCLLYTSPSPRDRQKSRMPSSA